MVPEKYLPVAEKLLNILKFDFCKFVLKIIVFCTSWYCLFLFIYGYVNFNKYFWFKYGLLLPVFTNYCLQVVCNLKQFSSWCAIKNQLSEKLPFNFTELPFQTRTEVLGLLKRANITFILLTIADILTVSSVTYETQKYIEMVFFEFFPDIPYNWIIIPVFIKYFPVFINCILALCIPATIYYSAYLMIMMRMHYIILSGMCEDFHNKMPLIYSKNYVSNGLKIIIQRHQNIVQILLLIKRWSFITHLILGVSVLTILIYNILLLLSPFYSNNYCIACVILFSIHLFDFCYQGQALENSIENFHSLLYNLDWYQYDYENANNFKTFFLNSSIRMEPINKFVQINYNFFMRSLTTAYALLNLAYSLLG